MATSWNGQICNGEGKYYIQFETDNKELYRLVEKTCQNAMDIAYPREIDITAIPESCRNCPNHPSNGGSEICNCILGQYSINAIPTASETMCESKAVATNKITEHELKVFNLYEEVKQSLEDAIKFESKEINNK